MNLDVRIIFLTWEQLINRIVCLQELGMLHCWRFPRIDWATIWLGWCNTGFHNPGTAAHYWALANSEPVRKSDGWVCVWSSTCMSSGQAHMCTQLHLCERQMVMYDHSLSLLHAGLQNQKVFLGGYKVSGLEWGLDLPALWCYVICSKDDFPIFHLSFKNIWAGYHTSNTKHYFLATQYSKL